MNKKTKQIILVMLVVFLIVIGGFTIRQITRKQSTDVKENVANAEDLEALTTIEKEDSKKTEAPSNNEEEEVDRVQEEILETESEEISEQAIEQPDESEPEESLKEPEEKPAEKNVTKKEVTPQSPPDTPKVAESKEVNQKSKVAMTEYLLPFSNSEERVEKTSHVVLHFTSNALNKPKNPYLIEDTYNIFKDYGVSAHYVIGRAGEVYLFVPENRVAYHAGRGQLQDFPELVDQLNHYSIGIELLGMGTREEMIPMITAEGFDLVDPSMIGFTEAQYGSLNTLLNDIIVRYPHIKKDRKHIVGHDEYSVGTKTDPGSLFNWSKIGF